MRVQVAEWGKLLPRGIYKLPAMGPCSEFILFAVMSDHRLTPTRFTIVPFGGALVAALERLESELDRYDPITDAIRREILKVS